MVDVCTVLTVLYMETNLDRVQNVVWEFQAVYLLWNFKRHAIISVRKGYGLLNSNFGVWGIWHLSYDWLTVFRYPLSSLGNSDSHVEFKVYLLYR